MSPGREAAKAIAALVGICAAVGGLVAVIADTILHRHRGPR